MKRKSLIIIFGFLLFCLLFYQTNKSSKSTNLIRNRKYIRIGRLLTNQTHEESIIELKDLSGFYQEVSSIERTKELKNFYSIEEIYFLLTTNTRRIRQTYKLIRFWSKKVKNNCLIVFEENDYLKSKYIDEYLQTKGISCQIKTSTIQIYEKRFFNLISLGYNYLINSNKTFKWFAIGDDDTIWFINNLLEELKQYNSSQKIYLGNISEKNHSIEYHGNHFAYGGGGILLTKPLIQLITNSSDQCLNEFNSDLGGDERIGKCLKEVLKINLTRNIHFHQIDLYGDIHGLFQSGIEGLITLHHIFSLWEPFPEEHSFYQDEILHIIESASNQFNFDYLKRFVKMNSQTNETFLLTLGYSFTRFNSILSSEEFNQIERTWNDQPLYQLSTRSLHLNKTNWFFKQFLNQPSNASIYQTYQKQMNHNLPNQLIISMD